MKVHDIRIVSAVQPFAEIQHASQLHLVLLLRYTDTRKSVSDTLTVEEYEEVVVTVVRKNGDDFYTSRRCMINRKEDLNVSCGQWVPDSLVIDAPAPIAQSVKTLIKRSTVWLDSQWTFREVEQHMSNIGLEFSKPIETVLSTLPDSYYAS
jgi:hypothetical protein